MNYKETNFYKEFEQNEEELIVLVQKECTGASPIEEKYLEPSVEVLAAINPVTDELIEDPDSLCWIIPKESSDWGFDFKKMTIYRVIIQRSKVLRCLFLKKIVEELDSEPRLDRIREEYMKPITIEDETGIFVLNREYHLFEGKYNWLGLEIDIYLEIDDVCSKNMTAEASFKSYKEFVSKMEEWDRKIREYVASELTDLANDWSEEEEMISEEIFAKRIKISEISFEEDGSKEITFTDDGMFAGHWVVVYIDEDQAFSEAQIEG